MRVLAWSGIIVVLALLWVSGASAGVFILAIIAWCVGMAYLDKRAGLVSVAEDDATSIQPLPVPRVRVINVRDDTRRPSNSGLVAGILGCLFATIGIFGLAIIFVPIALLCALAGLFRAAGGLSATGGAASILALVLTVVAAVTSPSIWIATALLIGTAATR